MFGLLLPPDHVGLERREVPAGVKGAQLGDSRLVLFHLALFGHCQPDGTAKQIGGLLFTFREQGVQHRGESFASVVGSARPAFFAAASVGYRRRGEGVLITLSVCRDG